MNERIKTFLTYLKENIDNEQKLKELQILEAKNIVLKDGIRYPPSSIAGIDIAYKDDIAYAACVTLNFKDLKVIEQKVAKSKVIFPYKTGYFVFREGPPILNIISKLKLMPDIFLINSHGISHPLGIGAASHIGILINKSTIGVAQEILCGEVQFPKKEGEYSPIYYNNQIVGVAFLSKSGDKPIFISPGHLITLDTSIKIIKNTLKNHKLPEPLVLSHKFAKLYKSKETLE